MGLSLLLTRVWRWIVRAFFRLRPTEEALAVSDGKFLDARIWAKIRGISRAEAEDQLRLGVELGHLRTVYLYEGTGSAVPLIVHEEDLGSTLPLSEFGIVEEDEEAQVYVSESFSREVFVAANGEGA